MSQHPKTRQSKTLFLLSALCFLHCRTWAAVSNVYIAQSQAGTADGSSCANAKAVSFFNTSSNWGTGANQIGPGTTAHLCGTFTGAANSTMLTFQGGGAVGNPITVLFEPGAVLTAPYWSVTGAISAQGLNGLVVDGGPNGAITSTANGTNLANPCTTGANCSARGIYFDTVNNSEIKNLTISNIYVHACNGGPPFAACTDDNGAQGSAGIYWIYSSGVAIDHNTIHDAFAGIYYVYNTGTSSNINIHHNTVTNTNWSSIVGSGAPNAILNGLQVNNNNFSGWDNWNTDNNAYHHDGVFIFTQAAGDLITNPVVNANILGSPATLMTAQISLDGANAGSDVITGALVSNNIIYNPPANTTGCPGSYVWSQANNTILANNTIIASIPGGCSGDGGAGNLGVNLEGTGAVYLNNIMTSCNYGLVGAPGSTIANSDYNDIYHCSSYGVQEPAASQDTLAAWHAAYPTLDDHSQSVNPNLNATTYSPNAGSPVIGAGINLKAQYCGTYPLLCADYNGNARPASAAWDIGAIQTAGGPSGPAANVYIAQSAAGSADGSSCANAKAVSFFNTSGNWGAGAGQIGPGTTVHLCGTFTGVLGSNILAFQGSGTPGNPITLFWEPGATLRSPACGIDGQACICGNGNSYITLDGNHTTASVQNTANGSSLANHVNTEAFQGIPCNNCTIKNWSAVNMYVMTNGTADPNGNGSAVYMSGSHILIDGFSCDQVFACYDHPYQNGDSAIEIRNSTFNHMNWGVHIGNNSTAALSNVLIHDNHLMTMSNWDDLNSSNQYHHDGLFVVQNNPAANITGVNIYSNLADGALGQRATAWIFWNTGIHGINVFNNILLNPNGDNGPYLIEAGFSGDTNYSIFNNTLDCGGGGAGGGGGINVGTVNGFSFENNGMNNCPTYLASQNISGTVTVNNNVYANGANGGNAFKWLNGGGTTFAAYRSANPSLDTHSATPANIEVDASYQPLSGSPLIGAGGNLTSLGIAALNVDRAGVSRPASGAWDAGAYQFSGAGLSPCDINGDGIPNALDVQLMANQALKIITCTSDINNDHNCDALDVQRVVNAALGGLCVTTP